MFAMADNPSSCINIYDTSITYMKVNNGLRTIDPHHNAEFSARVGKDYNITFTVRSASVISLDTASGKAVDHCDNAVNPNKDITITMYSVFMGQATHGTVQPVEWHY